MTNNLEKETKNIQNAICHITVFKNKDISDVFFEKLINFIDLSNISDRDFFSNERILKFVDYNRINKKQLIRLAVRNPEILNKVDLKKYKYKIKDLEYLIKKYPELIELFELDLKNLSGDELIILLNLSLDYANKIDFQNIKFEKYHLTELIKNFYHRDLIISKLLDQKQIVLDNFQIRHLILQTGDKHISKLNCEKLNEIDWYNILTNRPNLFFHCNMEIFEKNDCYLLTKLVKYIPALESLIIKNKEKISNLGWENLLKLDFEKYYPFCCFDCLGNKTREKFLFKLNPR